MFPGRSRDNEQCNANTKPFSIEAIIERKQHGRTGTNVWNVQSGQSAIMARCSPGVCKNAILSICDGRMNPKIRSLPPSRQCFPIIRVAPALSTPPPVGLSWACLPRCYFIFLHATVPPAVRTRLSRRNHLYRRSVQRPVNMRTVQLLALCLVAVTAKPTNDAALRAVSTAGSRFSSAFFAAVAEDEPGNLITSPLSASVVLSMTAYGAAGNTKRSMIRSLDLPNDDHLVQTGYQQLVDVLNNVKDVKLSVASRVFVHKNLNVKQSYKDLTATYFRSPAQEVNFGNANAAAKTINDWVKANTNNLIQELVEADNLSDDTGLILANAIYFKGQWKSKFNKQHTTEQLFHVNQQVVKKVPTMFQVGNYKYANLPELNAQLVEIPYKGDKISMVIVLPNTVDGLADVEKKIYHKHFDSLLDTTTTERLELSLPKFKIESKIELESALKKIGMGGIFSGNPDFSGISDTPLIVSKVVQKAFVEVNEEGSEAAGATESELDTRMGHLATPFNVNRPFLFSIVYAAGTPHSQVLFRGHVALPEVK